MIDTRALREAAEKATPGPWVNGYIYGQCHKNHFHEGKNCKYENELAVDDNSVASENKALSISLDNGYSHSDSPTADAQYIATANPQTILALLDQLDKMKNCLNCKYAFPGDGKCEGCFENKNWEWEGIDEDG